MVDLKQFLKAIDEFENYGIAKEITIQALKEAFSSLFVKKNYEDTRVEVNIDQDKGDISINLIKTVVENEKENELDDNIEITLDEAREIKPDINLGDDLYIPVEIDDFKKADALKFKSVFKQKIKEAEKQVIYQAFADKKGELITGVVEKIEPDYTLVNIGRTSVKLPNSRKIGDEMFSIGQNIKIYLSEINSASGGPQLIISRSDGGFLKRLFEEEVHEVYDGTVVIRDVARNAGERSKISVYSTVDNVDPIGACIGPGGTKIQKICSQLGKEKIDVVEYHEYPGLFIAESLKPAEVLGVNFDEETHSAIAVVKNDGLRVAIGRKGVNVFLAHKLTGWKIDIKEQDTAISEGITYLTIDQMLRKEEEIKLEKRRNELLKANEIEKADVKEEVIVDEEVETLPEDTYEEEKVEETPVKVEEKVEEAPVEIPFEEQKVEVNLSQPRVSLADLEKQIEQDKKKNQVQPKKKFVKKNEEIIDKPQVKEDEEKEEVKPTFNAMPIYSDEELEEFENEEEEENSYDDDIDYSDYDSYYDEK